MNELMELPESLVYLTMSRSLVHKNSTLYLFQDQRHSYGSCGVKVARDERFQVGADLTARGHSVPMAGDMVEIRDNLDRARK